MTYEIKYEGCIAVKNDDLVNLFSVMSASDYWCDVDFNGNAYETAKQNLIEKAGMDRNHICYEDVLIAILEMGG